MFEKKVHVTPSVTKAYRKNKKCFEFDNILIQQ